MHVNAAPVFLGRNCCVCLRTKFFSSRSLAECLRATRRMVFIKADIIGNKSAHTAVISEVDPEYLAAGEAQSA